MLELTKNNYTATMTKETMTEETQYKEKLAGGKTTRNGTIPIATIRTVMEPQPQASRHVRED